MKLNQLMPRAIVTAILALGASAAMADYPEKTITLVVPFAAGGGADNAARVLAQGMSDVSGQSVVIENKGGASGSIGAGYVARAKADGYTVLYDASSFALNPALRTLPYQMDDFVAVSQAIRVPNILVVSADSPFQTLDDLLKAARAEPGKHTFASYGPGSLAQMAGELLKGATQTDMLHVPYKGGAPALVDVMGGQVDTYFANAASSLGYVSSGRLRALAVSSPQRMPELPNVPTVAEVAVPGFDVEEWNGFFVPKGTPPEVVANLQKLVQDTLARPDVRERLATLGLTPVGSTSEEFTKLVNDERTRWQQVARDNNISAM